MLYLTGSVDMTKWETKGAIMMDTLLMTLSF